MSEQSKNFRLKNELAQKIKQKKLEILIDMERLCIDLHESRKELFDSLDLPQYTGVNTCGINQNQHTLDIKTGELKAMIALYSQM